MIKDKQEEDRRRGIGSSDVGTILGLNPWASPYDLWLVKTGQAAGPEENEAMRIGTVLEAGVLALAADRLGERIVKPTSTFVGYHPYMRANVDGMVRQAKRGSEIVEAKTTGATDQWGDEHTDEVPEHVKAQVMFQMMCASSDVAHIACLQGDYGLRLKMYRVPFDVEYAEYIGERVTQFWERNVLALIPPEGTAALDVLKRIRRDEQAAVVQIDPELFAADAAAKAAADQANAAAEVARAKLIAALGTATAGEGGEFRIRISQVETSRFDAKAFMAANPETAEGFMVRSAYARTTVGKKKGQGK